MPAALWFLFLCLGVLTVWGLFQGPGYADESYFHWLAGNGKVFPGTAAPWYFSWFAGESLLLLRVGCSLMELLGDGLLAFGIGFWLVRSGRGTAAQGWMLFPALQVGRMLCNWTTPPYADYVTLNQVAASAAWGFFFAGSALRGVRRGACFAAAGIIGVQFLFFAPPGLILILPVGWYFWGRRKWEPICFLLGCLLGAAGYFLLAETPGAYWHRLLSDITYYRTPCATEHHNIRETLLWIFWAFAGAVRCVLLPGCTLFLLLRNKGKEGIERLLRRIVPVLFLLNYLPEIHAGLSRTWSGGLPATLFCAFALGCWLDYAKKNQPGHRESVLWWTLLAMPLLLSFGSDMSFLHRCRCYSGFAVLAAVLAAVLTERKRIAQSLALLLVLGGVLTAFQIRLPLWSRKPESNVSLLKETCSWQTSGVDRKLRCSASQWNMIAELQKLAEGRKYLAGGKYLWHWRCRLGLESSSLFCFTSPEMQPTQLKRLGVHPEEILFVEYRNNRLMTPALERLFREKLGVKEVIRHRLSGPYDALTFR